MSGSLLCIEFYSANTVKSGHLFTKSLQLFQFYQFFIKFYPFSPIFVYFRLFSSIFLFFIHYHNFSPIPFRFPFNFHCTNQSTTTFISIFFSVLWWYQPRRFISPLVCTNKIRIKTCDETVNKDWRTREWTHTKPRCCWPVDWFTKIYFMFIVVGGCRKGTRECLYPTHMLSVFMACEV